MTKDEVVSTRSENRNRHSGQGREAGREPEPMITILAMIRDR